MPGILPRVGTGGGFADRSMQYQQNAIQSRGMQRPGSKTEQEAMDATAGGAVMSGLGGAMAGAQIGTMVSASSAAGPYGAAIGFVAGLAAYALS